MGTNEFADYTTQDEVTDAICDISWPTDANIPSNADYSLIGSTDISTVTGVALTGVVIMSAVSMNYVDPLYPKAWSTYTAATEGFDECLGHP